MTNIEIKETLRRNRIYLWEVAMKLGVSEITLCRWLRQDLPKDKQQQIVNAITEIVVERTKLI